MINKRELRIGNNVLYFGDLWTVEAHDLVNFDPEQIKGIPITDEWLLKLGGERDSDGCAFIYENKEADLRLYANDGWIQECKGAYGSLSWYKHIYSVHQLQNLYYALTGKELQYNDHV